LSPDLLVAGAGMAGLAAAARARELGAAVTLLEKGDRPGGSMLLSSGVIWRHRELERFEAECPAGDRRLQSVLHGGLDDALAWLEQLGARPLSRDTGNPLTTGVRFDTAQLTETLVRAAGGAQLSAPLDSAPAGVPLILATGGFHANRDLLREHVTPEADSLAIRGNPWSTGDGLRIGRERGAASGAGMDEFYGRNMPAPPATYGERDFVRLAQLYAAHATVTSATGEPFRTSTWSEIDVVQWTARQPSARAWYAVADSALAERVRDRSVAEMVEAARAAGAPVERRDGETVVEVAAAVTTTLGGLRIDDSAQASPGLFAAGADAGEIFTGGYGSGLAAALVFGRLAAESALAA
jgi:succinate dehydrogenase/fumarate reductase flavoprotein subunit